MVDKKEIFSVPEGYFSSLEMKLSSIPDRSAARNPRRFTKVSYMFAACACLVVLLGVHFFLNRSSNDLPDVYERYYYADLIPLTDPEMIFDFSEVVETCSTEDIENYLIETGTSLFMIEQTLN